MLHCPTHRSHAQLLEQALGDDGGHQSHDWPHVVPEGAAEVGDEGGECAAGDGLLVDQRRPHAHRAFLRRVHLHAVGLVFVVLVR